MSVLIFVVLLVTFFFDRLDAIDTRERLSKILIRLDEFARRP